MILITMAGLSRRFANAGYDKPKYMLNLAEKTVFDWSILSFKKYFNEQKFVFAIRDDNQTYDFIKKSIDNLAIKDFAIVIVANTEGQADTAYQALNNMQPAINQDLLIYNIDTFRPNFKYPDLTNSCDGYLEVFKGQGDSWSFALAGGGDDIVIKTAEKIRISDLCSTGLYYFKDYASFIKSYKNSLNYATSSLDGKERYIAPLYNFLISQGSLIKYHLIENKEVIFCGIPAEYEAINKKPPSYLENLYA